MEGTAARYLAALTAPSGVACWMKLSKSTPARNRRGGTGLLLVSQRSSGAARFLPLASVLLGLVDVEGGGGRRVERRVLQAREMRSGCQLANERTHRLVTWASSATSRTLPLLSRVCLDDVVG